MNIDPRALKFWQNVELMYLQCVKEFGDLDLDSLWMTLKKLQNFKKSQNVNMRQKNSDFFLYLSILSSPFRKKIKKKF